MSLITPLLYQSHMSEVKHRLHAIDRILGAKKPRTLNAEFDNEFMWLQLRQIVELVTFSAMLADEERYAAMRKEENATGDYQQDWRATRILDRLQKVSPHFLPQALGDLVHQPDGVKAFQGSTQQATRDRFVSIHETAGQHLHAANPANVDELFAQAERRLQSRERIKFEADYLKGVLWDHYKVGLEWNDGDAPTGPRSPTRAWIVSFGKPDTRDVQMLVAGVEIQPDAGAV